MSCGRLAVVLGWMPVLAGCGTALIPDPAVRYIAFGDSTTAGPGEVEYWQIVQERLGAEPEAFAGQGLGGESAADGAARLRELLEQGIYPNAEVLLYWQGGDALVEFIGQRDPLLLTSPVGENYPFTEDLLAALDGIQDDIESAIAAAQDAGLTVYVATYYPLVAGTGRCPPTPLGVLLPEQAERANEYVALLNVRIRAAAETMGAVLVDVAALADVLTADLDHYHDCNHLSEAGNGVVADVFVDALAAEPGL